MFLFWYFDISIIQKLNSEIRSFIQISHYIETKKHIVIIDGKFTTYKK